MDSSRFQFDEVTEGSNANQCGHESFGLVASFVGWLETFGDGSISTALLLLFNPNPPFNGGATASAQPETWKPTDMCILGMFRRVQS